MDGREVTLDAWWRVMCTVLDAAFMLSMNDDGGIRSSLYDNGEACYIVKLYVCIL